MKGAVKRNISPPTGRREELVAASPASVETVWFPAFEACGGFINNAVSSSEN
jgi:hypothetical protein